MTFEGSHKKLSKASRYSAIAGGLGILAISVMITIDVLLRKFFHTTLGGATEIAGFLFAAGTALSYPYVLIDRANIRIDAAYTHFSVRMRAILDTVTVLSVLFFIAILSKSIFGVWLEAIHTNAKTIGVINVPRWVVQTPWVMGYIFFVATALFLAVYSVKSLVAHNWQLVSRISGVPSIEETIEEETHIEIEHDTGADAPSLDEGKQ